MKANTKKNRLWNVPAFRFSEPDLIGKTSPA